MASFWSKVNVAKRRLIQRAAVALVAYEVMFLATMWWVERSRPSDSAMLWLAVVPTLPVVGVILVMAHYLKEEVDEFHRELVVRCLLWGTAAVMVLLAFHGFLQLFGWKGSWSVMVDLGAFVGAMAIAKLTYRVANRPPAEDVVVEGRA